MRFLLLFLTLALGGACKPIHDTQRELQKRDLAPLAQHGLTFGLSFTAIVAAAIGITEYATNFYHRYNNDKAQQEHLAWEDRFARQKKETDKRISTSAHDVVLDLVDKWVKKGKAAGEEESEEEPTGDSIMLDSDEIVDVEPLPLPKLYGFPMQPKPVVQEEACTLDEDCGPVVQRNHPSSDGEGWSGGEGYQSDFSDQAEIHPICREIKTPQS